MTDHGWTVHDPPIKPEYPHYDHVMSAGMLLRLVDDAGHEEEVLVGDVSELGGQCDCCGRWTFTTMKIVASRRVWGPS